MSYADCQCDGDPTGDGDQPVMATAIRPVTVTAIRRATVNGEPTSEDPVADIFHPGDGEVRPVNVPIPFIGDATAECRWSGPAISRARLEPA